MRKRLLWILLALSLGICVAGCGKKEEETSAPAEEEFSTEDEVFEEVPEVEEEEPDLDDLDLQVF